MNINAGQAQIGLTQKGRMVTLSLLLSTDEDAAKVTDAIKESIDKHARVEINFIKAIAIKRPEDWPSGQH